MIIAVGSIMHESNTFSNQVTDLDAFRRREFLVGEDVITAHKDRKSEIGGFLSVLDGKAEVHPTISAYAMPSGLVTREAYDYLLSLLISQLRKRNFDAVLLALHGSMCVDGGLEDPEGDILAAVRQNFPDTVIACTLDHHANVTELMIECADITAGYRTHPHVDQFDTGKHAAALLLDTRYRSAEKQFIKLPLVTPAENRPEPISVLRKRVEEICETPGVITASFFVGYPWADVSIIGASVYVLVEENVQVNYALDLARLFWSIRDTFGYRIYTLASIEELLLSTHKKPLVLNELSDCTYGGSSGDAVATASFLIERRISGAAVVGIVDPETVDLAFRIGPGGTGNFTVGGKICRKHNPSLSIHAKVFSLHENVCPNNQMYMESGMHFTKVAVLEADGVHLMIIEYPGRIGGPSFFEALGLSALDYKVIAVKEGLNPFVTYRDICEDIIMIDSPGFNPQNLTPDLYHNLTRKLYPIHPGDSDLKIFTYEGSQKFGNVDYNKV